MNVNRVFRAISVLFFVCVAFPNIGHATHVALNQKTAHISKRQIMNQAKNHEIKPIEPYVDNVWHLIPGLNGRQVNLTRTMQHATSKKKIQWYFSQTRPTKTLSDFPYEPIYRGNPDKPMVALLVNVSWGEAYIPAMLKICKQKQIKLTFFLDGKWLKKHIQLVNQMKLVHEISNHGYNHHLISQSSDSQIRADMKTTEKELNQIGIPNRYFAPPAGDFNSKSLRIAHEQGLRTILWTIDTIDWKDTNPQSILNRVRPKIANGTMILMHPTPGTVGALPKLIDMIRHKGLQIGTVSELLDTKRVEVE
jgi:probable sporulation protein (polysaccharide deacetylase family)